MRITDSTRTSRQVRDVPQQETSLENRKPYRARATPIVSEVGFEFKRRAVAEGGVEALGVVDGVDEDADETP